jgi:anion-transporting  ArsA/GET3 family ATPase
VSRELFQSRWSLDDLQQIDPELHAALLDQQAMLDEHTKAMERGWQTALARMEAHEIAAALAVFPGAKVTATRPKQPPDVD